jgi:polyisoprenoid-binding protein YceI
MRGLAYAGIRGLILALGVFVAASMPATANGPGESVVVEIDRGTVSFDVGTNIPAIRVHGKSNAVTARAQVVSGPDGMVLGQITASVPPQSFKTGLALRDEHMRKSIFTTADGETPDVRFVGERGECVRTGSRHEASCTVNGTLVIRDTPSPFTIVLAVSDEKGGLRASGEAIVKLSAHGIDQPSQLGVRTADEVKLKLELSARRPDADAAGDGRGER